MLRGKVGIGRSLFFIEAHKIVIELILSHYLGMESIDIRSLHIAIPQARIFYQLGIYAWNVLYFVIFSHHLILKFILDLFVSLLESAHDDYALVSFYLNFASIYLLSLQSCSNLYRLIPWFRENLPWFKWHLRAVSYAF